MKATRTIRAFGFTVLIATLIGFANEAAQRLLPRVPSAASEPRNPYRFRGWPEFTRWEKPPPGAGRMILLSNSQAYAGEVDPRRIYPQVMARRLGEVGAGGFTNWQVLNWSVEGVTSMEYMLLAARATRHQPDLLVAAVALTDFRSANVSNTILFGRSDIHRLAARPRLVRQLPASFVARHFTIEDTLTAVSHDSFALVRYRDYLWNWLDRKWPGLQPAFYAPLVNYHPWGLKSVRARARLGPVNWVPADQRDLDYSEASRPSVKEFIDQLGRVPARLRLVVMVPVRDQAGGPLEEMFDRFRDDLSDSCAAAQSPVAFLDLHDAVPPEGFIDAAHLRTSYHTPFGMRMADELHQRLDR